MPEGQGFDFYNFKTVTHVSEGIQDNTFAYSAKDGTNPDNYNIKIVPGTVQVVSSETPIVVKANEDSKVYDGAPLVNSGFSYTQGVLPEGFTLEASVSPEKELINVGHTYNVVDKDSIKIYDSDGKDVTGDFKLATPEKGKLEITKREITVKSNDAT